MCTEEEAAGAIHEPPIEHPEGATQDVLHNRKPSTTILTINNWMVYSSPKN
jgi:hypothetical protein